MTNRCLNSKFETIHNIGGIRMNDIERKLGEYKTYTAADASKLFGGREIILWGAGQKGRGFLGALRRNGFDASIFLDRSLAGKFCLGIPVINPDSFLSDKQRWKNCFIIIAMGRRNYLQCFSDCEKAGLIKFQDFINVQELSPYYPSVEISGVCNLRCLACPRSMQTIRGKMLSLEKYRSILLKMIREIPFLYLVDTYLWGDPLLNPELPDIIKLNKEHGVMTGISTNLNAGKHLEDVVAAGPAQISIAMSGYGPQHYEITHAGGKWSVLHANLEKLAAYVERYDVTETKPIITICMHINRLNWKEIPDVKKMCIDLGFNFSPLMSTIFPDHAMDILNGQPLSENVRKSMDIMPLPMDKRMAKCVSESDKVCQNKRCVPTIYSDGSVLACCNYSTNRPGNAHLAENYLDVSLSEIMARRMKSPLCTECLRLNLHRYFAVHFPPDDLAQFVDEMTNA